MVIRERPLPEARISQSLAQGDVEGALYSICKQGLSAKSITALRMKAMIELRKQMWSEVQDTLNLIAAKVPDGFTHKMFGDFYFLQNRFPDAVKHYKRASEEIPNSPDIIHDLGVALNQSCRFDEAEVYMRKAIELAPERYDMAHHLAIILCQHGKTEEGWKLMDARLKYPGIVGNFPKPEAYWTGQDLKDKVIVLRAEQGFGDTIQFSRYTSELLKMGSRKVYLYIQPEMVEWAKRYYTDPRIVSWPNKAPPPKDFDYHVNMMSLPQHFMGNPVTVPKKPKEWTGNIGICWFGSPAHKGDAIRTIPLEKWERLFNSFPDIRWKCLAWGHFVEKPDQIDYFIDECYGWHDTAERVEELDLVISVDTAIVHLAGAHGVPTWMLTPKVPDFRWGLEGEQEWYESVTLYRQKVLFEWDEVFDRIIGDLKTLRRF
jgi:hypothetical protein